MADPNHIVLDEDSSDEENEGENSFLKVNEMKQYPSNVTFAGAICNKG